MDLRIAVNLRASLHVGHGRGPASRSSRAQRSQHVVNEFACCLLVCMLMLSL